MKLKEKQYKLKQYKLIVNEIKLLRQRIKKYGKCSLQFDVIKNKIIELENELKIINRDIGRNTAGGGNYKH